MVEGQLTIVFDNSDNFDTFYEVIELLRKAGIMPEEFDWDYEVKGGSFEAVLFSKHDTGEQA
jgi:hypothetical protein